MTADGELRQKNLEDDYGRFDGVKNIGAMNPSDSNALSIDGRSLASFLLVTDVRMDLLQAQYDDGKARGLSPEDMGMTIVDGCIVDEGRERIITEILDAAQTKSLLAQLECSGYVLSNRIVSDLIAQVMD